MKKKRRGRLIVLNKAVKIVLKKVKIQKRQLNEIALTIVSKPSLEQFHEYKSEVRGLEALLMALKPLLVCQTRSARLKFVKRAAARHNYLFLDECLKYIFFQLPKLKKKNLFRGSK